MPIMQRTAKTPAPSSFGLPTLKCGDPPPTPIPSSTYTNMQNPNFFQHHPHTSQAVCSSPFSSSPESAPYFFISGTCLHSSSTRLSPNNFQLDTVDETHYKPTKPTAPSIIYIPPYKIIHFSRQPTPRTVSFSLLSPSPRTLRYKKHMT